MGSFGGTYWRPIYSSVTKKKYKDQHKKYPKSWWNGISKEKLVVPWSDYDRSINKYGWVQWYCDFFMGKRSSDDERQIKRWIRTAGPKSRFRRMLTNLIKKKKGKYDNFDISPKIRQVLQHWAYVLTKEDFDNEVKRRNE